MRNSQAKQARRLCSPACRQGREPQQVEQSKLAKTVISKSAARIARQLSNRISTHKATTKILTYSLAKVNLVRSAFSFTRKTSALSRWNGSQSNQLTHRKGLIMWSLRSKFWNIWIRAKTRHRSSSFNFKTPLRQMRTCVLSLSISQAKILITFSRANTG